MFSVHDEIQFTHITHIYTFTHIGQYAFALENQDAQNIQQLFENCLIVKKNYTKIKDFL